MNKSLMQIAFLDKDFKPVHVIVNWLSFLWSERFYEVGDFELHLLETESEFLNQAKYLYNNNSNRIGVIQAVEILDKNIIIRGEFLECILRDRVIMFDTEYRTYPNNVIRNAITNSTKSPYGINRLQLGTNISMSNTIELVATGKNLLDEIIIPICEENKIGFQLIYDFNTDKINANIVKGKDKTQKETNSEWVVLSSKLGNIMKDNYIYDERNYKNFAYVVGDYDKKPMAVRVNRPAYSGEDIKMLYVSASDISCYKDAINQTSGDFTGTQTLLSKSAYEKLLINKGIESLNEQRSLHTVNLEVDFSKIHNIELGDYITYINDTYKLLVDLQVTSIEYVYEIDNLLIHYTLGSDSNKILKNTFFNIIRRISR